MFGRKMLNGQSKPVQCVLSYQDKFIEALAEIGENPNQHSKQIQYNGNLNLCTYFYLSLQIKLNRIKWDVRLKNH